MKTVNEVRLLGNVGRDPDVRATGAGGVVANFSLATNEGHKNAAGEWQDHPF
jgi:single-strand DNA-binding protein